MIYYGIVCISVVMFGLQFFFNDRFEKINGSGMRVILKFSLISNAVGAVILFFVNKCRFEMTPFSLIMSLVTAVDTLGYSFCSFKALGKINLSLYSLFAMLGGMALPFIAGIAFFDEKLTWATVICFVFIAAALLLTVQKDSEKKSGTLYYIGVFIFNGMSGVLAKIFQSAPYEKGSEAGFSVLRALCVAVVCVILLLVNREKNVKFSPASVGYTAGCGILGCVANLLLLIGLTHLPASAQYPMVTGGVMIVSTVMCYFTPNKPQKREIISVILSFAGILALVLIPC